MAVHIPVLLEEVLSLLKPEGKTLLVDATLGEGGHAEAFLSCYPELRLFGIEADRSIYREAAVRLEAYGGRVKLFNEWFDEFFTGFEERFDERPSRVFFDLGISRFHYELSGRGFSFRKDEPLDMRIGEGTGETAGEVINNYPEDRLAELIATWGEERFARRIARFIGRERREKPITRARELAEIIWKAVPPAYRYGPIHPATRTFQALRIWVNDELGRLEAALPAALGCLSVGGRLGVISFHSLEDRMVKRFFQQRNKTCTCPPELPICKCGARREVAIITRKAVAPSAEEIGRNPASRSAKLRVVEKLKA